jgi:hypothetical protein
MTKKNFVLLVIFFGVTSRCFGYIDPGTGSYLVQILIAVVVGASLGIKIFWNKIKTFWGKLFSREGIQSENRKNKE